MASEHHGDWWNPARILFEDEDLIAVDKPPFVPCQAVSAGRVDDVPTRLARHLERRDGTPARLGIHQRLDAVTSGVLLYARSERGNQVLSKAFGSRTAIKHYVACVTGYRGGPRTLRHRLLHERGLTREDPRGHEAITRVERVETAGERSWLELSIETGRTHQIRAQLAAIGAPIIGDWLYGGAPDARLMLHAKALSIPERSLHIEAEVPIRLHCARFGESCWERKASIEACLDDAFERRFAQRVDALETTNAYRLFNEAGDGLPGLAIDIYRSHAVLHSSGPEAESYEEDLARWCLSRGPRGVYVKRRPRQSNRIDDDERLWRAPPLPIAGDAAEHEFTIQEHGIELDVRLDDGMSTGLFLDQRETRAKVRALARGRRVLNLFAYTGAFSAAAIAGGARSTVTVDASGAALDRARRNLGRAGRDDRDADRTVRADVFEWLDKAARKAPAYDLVCCDPPTYSVGSRGRWTSGKAWRGLAASCARVTAANGVLILSSNDRRMSKGAFRAWVRGGVEDAGRNLRSLRDIDPPADFPAWPGTSHLKVLCAELD